ncbi:MAG: hypothetical protein LBK75_08295 [Oscillospiraceae bacterium]|nr:hypothetical protein [Oscillospiraceae bacterium]
METIQETAEKRGVPRIAGITRWIHPKDLLWIARTKSERLEAAMTDVFSSIFLQHVDKSGDSVDTPEGYNIKRYGVFEGRYGIYKQRISPLSTCIGAGQESFLCAVRQRPQPVLRRTPRRWSGAR